MKSIHSPYALNGRLPNIAPVFSNHTKPETPNQKPLHGSMILTKKPTYEELEQRVLEFEKAGFMQKQTEEALRESTKRFRSLYQSMQDAFALVDMNGQIREDNEAFKAMLGYTGEEIIQLSYNDITPAKWHAHEAAERKNGYYNRRRKHYE